jgi:hypothetical protein
MSIPDRTAVARTFVLASRNGLDATYVCTNPAVGDSIQIVQRQTRPTKAGSLNSVNVKCMVGYTDATTGISYPVDANLTVRFRNDDRVSLHTERIQQAIVLAVRSFTPFDAATIVGTASETNLKNAELGALPTL